MHMASENITLIEINQMLKDKHYMIPFIWDT